jgi:replicative DNA helicase
VSPCNVFISAAFEDIQTLSATKNHVSGLKTRFPELDALTTGFQNGELIVIAARPSVGKTSLALNLAEDFMKADLPILFISIEMTEKQLGFRLLSADSRVDFQKMRKGYLNDAELKRVVASAGRLHGKKLFIDDSSAPTVLEVKAKARRYKKTEGIKALFVDYLQIMQPGTRCENREREISFMSSQLKALAKDLQIPVFVLSQLRRPQQGSEDRRPFLSDLRESGAIEQDAATVVFIHNEKVGEEKINGRKRNIYEPWLLVAKQRNGPIDDVKVFFRKDIVSFEPMANQRVTVDRSIMEDGKDKRPPGRA